MAEARSGTRIGGIFLLQIVPHSAGNVLHNKFAKPPEQIKRLFIRGIYLNV